jgi:hypothetical protein
MVFCILFNVSDFHSLAERRLIRFVQRDFLPLYCVLGRRIHLCLHALCDNNLHHHETSILLSVFGTSIQFRPHTTVYSRA